MVVIDERDTTHTWVWCDESETKAVKLPNDRTGYKVFGLTDTGQVNIVVHQEEITCSLVQGSTRGLCMPRHVAAMNGLHRF